MTLRFLLVCEGSSDAALIHHISRLLLKNGHSDPQGQSWTRSGPLVNKIREGLQFSGPCDLLLVHRDADSNVETPSAGPERRHREILCAVRDSGFQGPWVAIVPVHATESWLLLDEPAIRQIAGHRAGVSSLELPLSNRVEDVTNPKDRLWKALVAASGLSGRHLRRFERDMAALRHQLLYDLAIGGPLEQVSSWVRFRNDLLAALAPAHPPTGL